MPPKQVPSPKPKPVPYRICFVCFDPIPIGAWAYMHGDCQFECIACSGKTRSEPEPQTELFQ
jgi:hypothetical protein